MGWVEGLWNTRWKAACPQPASALSPLCTHQHIAKMCQQCSHGTRRMPGELMRYDRAGCFSVALDWTGLGVVAGQRGACAYTPVNKLRGGKCGRRSARWQTRALRAPEPNVNKRRRAVSVSPCRHTIPRRAAAVAATREGAGGLGGPVVAQRGEERSPRHRGATVYNRLSRMRWWVDDWVAVEAEWQMASGLLCCSVSDGGP